MTVFSNPCLELYRRTEAIAKSLWSPVKNTKKINTVKLLWNSCIFLVIWHHGITRHFEDYFCLPCRVIISYPLNYCKFRFRSRKNEERSWKCRERAGTRWSGSGDVPPRPLPSASRYFGNSARSRIGSVKLTWRTPQARKFWSFWSFFGGGSTNLS